MLWQEIFGCPSIKSGLWTYIVSNTYRLMVPNKASYGNVGIGLVPAMQEVLLREEILHQLIGSAYFFPCLQGFLHRRFLPSTLSHAKSSQPNGNLGRGFNPSEKYAKVKEVSSSPIFRMKV